MMTRKVHHDNASSHTTFAVMDYLGEHLPFLNHPTTQTSFSSPESNGVTPCFGLSHLRSGDKGARNVVLMRKGPALKAVKSMYRFCKLQSDYFPDKPSRKFCVIQRQILLLESKFALIKWPYTRGTKTCYNIRFCCRCGVSLFY